MLATQLGEMWSHAQVACMFVGAATRRLAEAQRAGANAVGPWEYAVERLVVIAKDARELEHEAARAWERMSDADTAELGRPLLADAIGLAVRHIDRMLELAREQLRERALDVTDGEVRS
jgi:hypothetical protein